MQALYKPAPDDYTFYYPPQELLKGEHGEVIWSRPLEGVAALKAARVNQLVLYRSRDVHDKPVAVSGIIALPRTAAPEDGYPIVSWAHGTVGSADTLAPSRDERPAAHPFNQYPHKMLNAFLDKGWAVLMTDYEGLGTGPEEYGPYGLGREECDPEKWERDPEKWGRWFDPDGRGPEGLHPFLLGASQARGILDIVLAARQLYPDQLSNRLAIVGHSQGGQAALFGAHHAPTWTPDLDLRGVAALAPASKTRTLVEMGIATPSLSEDGGYAFTALFLSGAISGNPNIKPKELLSENAYKVWPHIYTRARIELAQDDSWGGLKGTDQLNSSDNPSKSLFLEQLSQMHPNLRIHAPIRISQAAQDQRIIAAVTFVLYLELAAKNGPQNVEYVQHPEVPLTDYLELGYHFGLMEKDLPFLTKWLEKRFAETD